MSRLPFKGWKTAHRALGLGVLGTCLSVATPALAGSVVIPQPPQTEIPTSQLTGADRDSVFTATTGPTALWSTDPSAPMTAPVADDTHADPLDAIARLSAMEASSRPMPMLDVAPPNPFALPSIAKPQEPVKSIPALPAVWSGMSGLVVLAAAGCARRVRRAWR